MNKKVKLGLSAIGAVAGAALVTYGMILRKGNKSDNEQEIVEDEEDIENVEIKDAEIIEEVEK